MDCHFSFISLLAVTIQTNCKEVFIFIIYPVFIYICNTLQ